MPIHINFVILQRHRLISPLTHTHMTKVILTDSFKIDFNRQFKLDIDGKLYGLNRLVEFGIFPLFMHKFNKMVLREKKYHQVKSLNHVAMRISGHTVKCYFI